MFAGDPVNGWTVWMETVRGLHFRHRRVFDTPEKAQRHADIYIRVRPAWLREIRVYPPNHSGDYHSRELFDGN